jgi:catechol 2,3-dioxygenase
MPAAVRSLGHVGYFVQDLEVMTEFWRDFMGMTLTKSSDMGSFFSGDPKTCDHEIALLKNPTVAARGTNLQQISLRVDSLDDLRDFKRRVIERGYKIDELVTHASSIGFYFRDPENNPVETFWLTGLDSWAMIAVPIDIDRPDVEVMADVRRVWDISRNVEMGVAPEGDLKAALARVRSEGLETVAAQGRPGGG